MEVKIWMEEHAPEALKALDLFEQNVAATEIAARRAKFSDEREGKFVIWTNLVAAHAAGMLVLLEIGRRQGRAELAMQASGVHQGQIAIAKSRIGICEAIKVELTTRMQAIEAAERNLREQLGIQSAAAERVEESFGSSHDRALK